MTDKMTPAEALAQVIYGPPAITTEQTMGNLRALGFAVVPIEPDEVMVERGARAFRRRRDDFCMVMHASANVQSWVCKADGDEERVFGPAPDEECEQWLDAQCARAAYAAMVEPQEKERA